MPTDPPLGVRGANLEQDDALAGEWVVVVGSHDAGGLVAGSHRAGALIAKGCGDAGLELGRRFEFVVSRDGALVLDAARSLLSRLVPLSWEMCWRPG
jgi:DICT domain-containing protein